MIKPSRFLGGKESFLLHLGFVFFPWTGFAVPVAPYFATSGSTITCSQKILHLGSLQK
jgi:hypothetical protein